MILIKLKHGGGGGGCDGGVKQLKNDLSFRVSIIYCGYHTLWITYQIYIKFLQILRLSMF